MGCPVRVFILETVDIIAKHRPECHQPGNETGTTVRPEPFDCAQDRLVEGRWRRPGFDKLSPNGI
jgi:hypothetical protein